MISKDLANKKILVVREFDAPLEKVWRAWTDSELLDQWWAPKPWKANTKSMDFREGGRWLYYMAGPDGERHYCRFDYETIDGPRSYTGADAFCDEEGNDIGELPNMHWNTKFSETATGTKVEVEISFSSKEDLEKIIEMGFKEGFTAAHGNLDELLAK
ncbi:SRPBCC domain-containing protein [Flavihumibacter sp. R14]|nr:SRPBCC domain-containing protein [Flavihumibacter soli]